MNKKKSQHDLFGDISIDRPNSTLARPVRSTPQPHFSRQAIPPKTKIPFPLSLLLTLLAIGAIGYLACGYFILPYLIKTIGAQAIARHLGRPITIGQVEFDPLKLRLTLINGIVGPLLSNPSDKIDPILSFSRLSLNLEAVSLPRRALICRDLTLDQPFLHLVHEATGKYNLATLVSSPAAEKTPPLVWILSNAVRRHSINNIKLTRGEVRYDDQAGGKAHRLEEVTLTLPTIENISYHSGTLHPQFSAQINNTPIAMSGQTTLSPQGQTTAHMNLKMANLDLAAYKDYLPPSLGLESLGGQADIDLDLLYDGASTEKFRLIGEVALRSFHSRGIHGQLNIDSGRITGWLAPISGQFHGDSIILTHPVWLRPAGKAHPWQYLAGALTAPGTSQQRTLPISLLQITNGEILSPPDSSPSPVANWKGVDASITTAQAPDGPDQAFFSLNARSDTTSRLSIQGSAGCAPLTAKGLLIVNDIDTSTIQGLWQVAGRQLPVTGGTLEQAQTNFEISLTSEGQPLLHLAPLAIQAKNIQINLNGQTLEIPGWQSEQGSFHTNDPTLHLGKVRLQQAQIACRRTSATTSWQTPLTGEDGRNALPLAVDVKGLELINSSLLVENLGPPDIALRLERFDLQVDQMDSSQPNNVNAAAMLDDTYPIQATGTFTLSPFTATLNVQATDVPLTAFQPLIDHYFDLPASGTLTASGALSLPALDYTGNWFITELATPPISCRKIAGEETTIRLRPLSVSIGQLNLDGPSVQISASENGMPILPTVLTPGWQPGPTADKAIVAIKAITITEGSLTYDFPGPPGLTINHNKINGSLSDFIVAADQLIPFTFSGTMESTAEFEAKGTIRPFAAKPTMALTSSVKGLPLSSLAAVIEPHWGFTIKEGTLDFENNMTFENTLIHDKSQLTIKDLKLGKPLAPQAIKAIGTTWETLPLIQALFQDANGAITVSIPIDGRTDTGFTYLEGMKAFLNQLMLKATVSPLTLLDNAQKEIPETIDFKAGSEQLSPAMEERLTPLSTFLKEHPMAAITLEGSTDPSDQKALLRGNKTTGKEQSPREALKKLAMQRARSVKEFLTSHGAASRQIDLSGGEETAPGKTTKTSRRQVTISVTEAEKTY